MNLEDPLDPVDIEAASVHTGTTMAGAIVVDDFDEPLVQRNLLLENERTVYAHE